MYADDHYCGIETFTMTSDYIHSDYVIVLNKSSVDYW